MIQLHAALLTLIDLVGTDALGAQIRLVTDSQASAAAIHRMKGAPGMFDLVKNMYLIAHKVGARIVCTWESRSTEKMQLADLLSRSQDSGQLYTAPATFDVIRAKWGSPTVDVFAGPGKLEHVIPHKFYIEFPHHRGIGSNAFARSWHVPGPNGETPFAYVFPPSGHELQAIVALAEQRVDAILVLPHLRDLPIWLSAIKEHLPVAATMELKYQPGLIITGPRAPSWLRYKKISLKAFLI